MLVTVKLLGELGRRFGREWKLYAKTPAEVIRLIACQTEGFVEYLHSSGDRGLAWRVVSGDALGMAEDGLLLPCSDVLVIAPIVQGAGAIGRIILGIALIATAFLVPGGVLGLSATTIGLTGAALLFGGIAMLLSPTPKTPDDKRKDSYLFDRNAEVTQQGVAVPVLYGERLITGFPVLSAAIDVFKVDVNDDDDD